MKKNEPGTLKYEIMRETNAKGVEQVVMIERYYILLFPSISFFERNSDLCRTERFANVSSSCKLRWVGQHKC